MHIKKEAPTAPTVQGHKGKSSGLHKKTNITMAANAQRAPADANSVTDGRATIGYVAQVSEGFGAWDTNKRLVGIFVSQGSAVLALKARAVTHG